MRKLPDNIDSKFRFITIAAKRCEMLQKGAKPKLEDDQFFKSTTLAMAEVMDGLIDFSIPDQPQYSEEDYEEIQSSNY
jgi:DNA-directed RNA polymerase omega subunit